MRSAETAVEAARHRLRIIGLTDEQITALRETGGLRRAIPIYSPIEGTVVGRKVGPGQYVRSEPSDQLYTIADLSTVWLKAYVPENDIPFIRLGQEIEVKVSAIPDRVFKARVTHIGAMFDATTRRMLVRSEIANPDGVLKGEMFASFKITTGESMPAPALPAEAVIRERDLASVWVEEEPMVFRRRTVRLGMEQNRRIEIREGLKGGELAVTRGAIFLDNEWRQ
jgi:membrane fusion protein, heavy metal efflux system